MRKSTTLSSRCPTQALIFISDSETDFPRETASLGKEGRTTSPVLKEADEETHAGMVHLFDRLASKIKA
jgi:glutaredoxin